MQNHLMLRYNFFNYGSTIFQKSLNVLAVTCAVLNHLPMRCTVPKRLPMRCAVPKRLPMRRVVLKHLPLQRSQSERVKLFTP